MDQNSLTSRIKSNAAQFFNTEIGATTLKNLVAIGFRGVSHHATWSGFCSAADINRLDAFLKRCNGYEYVLITFPI